MTMYLGTVRHTPNGVTASIHWDLKSTLATRRYMCGLDAPHYPMPAIPLAVKRGGISWRWISIYNPVTRKIKRFWHEDGSSI